MFRKCYIIAYKSFNGFSSPFSDTEQKTNLKKALISLFNNQKPEETADQHTRTDAGSYSDWFDAETDEILFFDFGINRNKFDYNNPHYPKDKEGIFNYFIDNFFLLQNRYSTNGGIVESFFDSSFVKCRNNIRGTVAPSRYVFPLILSKLPKEIAANEYYFIMLDDYNDPARKGQNEEIKRLNEAIHKQSRLILENDFINPMYSKTNYYKIFEYGYEYFPDGYNSINPARDYVYLVGYKIIPENIEKPSIESNIKLVQLKYGEYTYNQNAIKIRFPHSEYLHINSIYEDLFSDKGNVLNRKIEVNKESDFYMSLPADVKLAGLVHKHDILSFEEKYTFNADLQLLDAPNCKLGLIYTTQRAPKLEDVFVFQNAIFTIIMYWFQRLLPFIVFIILALLSIAIYRGRVKNFKVEVSGFTEKFKEMKNCTITEHDYYTWNAEKKRATLNVKIIPEYCRNFKIKWGYRLNIKPTIENLEKAGLVAEIHKTDGSDKKPLGSEFQPDEFGEYGITISQTAGATLNFEKQRYIFEVITNYNVEQRFLFLRNKNSRNNQNSYKFETGKDLGKIWIGFDPGTTSSSAAFGSDKDNIYFSKVKDGKKLSEINSSVIAFNKNLSVTKYKDWRPNEDYLYGNTAAGRRNLKSKFRSMKKTLGYEEKYPIEVDGTELFKLEGQQIFELQVRGMYKGLKDYFEGTGNGYLTTEEKNELCQGKGDFLPKRAVVAIPNCFTSRRTQAMIDSIASLGKFDEIISTYEAESVLYYCIKESIVKQNAKVMIFDMGGATINTSFFDYKNERGKYKIDTLGRIGYGIGGDTIDFCIIEAILDMPSVRNALDIDEKNVKEYRDNNARKLIELALNIKHEDIVANFKNNTKESLISANRLKILIEKHLSVNINELTDELDEFKTMFENAGKYFFNTFIEPVVYKNIRDAIDELTAFDEVMACKQQLITLIFSGRSTAFPFIKENVTKELGKQGFKKVEIKDLQQDKSLDNLKTIVAEGACWYGINRQNIEVTNNKVFHSFIVKHSFDGSHNGTDFIHFIKQGQRFEKNNDGNLEIRESRDIKENAHFEFDNNLVKIYQVTGNNPKELYNKKGLKHKITFVTSLEARREIKKLVVVLRPDDSLESIAKFDRNESNDIHAWANTKSVEIASENDEHYIFALKNNG
jgi:hypothetical protein